MNESPPATGRKRERTVRYLEFLSPAASLTKPAHSELVSGSSLFTWHQQEAVFFLCQLLPSTRATDPFSSHMRFFSDCGFLGWQAAT